MISPDLRDVSSIEWVHDAEEEEAVAWAEEVETARRVRERKSR